MRVVIVGGKLPYPPNAGNRIRTLNLTLRLAGRHRITFICHTNPDRDEAGEARAFLNDRGIETIEVDHEVPPQSGPAFYARLAANLASPLPYSIASHNGPGVRRAVEAYAAGHEVDLWQAEAAPYIEAMRGLAGVRKLMMAHNVETLIWQRYHETERHPLKRWYIKRQWEKFERYERRAFAESTRVVTVSDEDARLVRDRFGVPSVDVVENGIDRAYFEAVKAEPEPGLILFLGSLEWRPNLDAVGLLLDRIFPEVLAEEPTARLRIVGRNPPEPLARRIRSSPNVELLANVADVRPHLASSEVMAVPLRIGGGSRLKILEALASGLPVVSTRVGAEGLRLEPGRDLEVVAEAETMSRALLGCLRAPGPAREMAGRGRRLVLDRYDWDALADDLERSWGRCLEGRPGRDRDGPPGGIT